MRIASGILDVFYLGLCLLVGTTADPHSARARYLGKSHHSSTLSSDSLATDGTQILVPTAVGEVIELRQRNLYDSTDTFYDSTDTTAIQASADARFTRKVKNGLGQIIFGIIFFLIAFPIQWYNEERSARMEILFKRGLSECVSIGAEEVNQENHGRLVHVQGWARATVPITDPQFQDAQVTQCLKLQSTLEVFEWIQTTRTLLDGKERWSVPRFHTEWTTNHQDSQRFKKPSPENPRLPSGISLGTFTQTCPRIEMGVFVLTKEMVESFHKFSPAMKYLPPVLNAYGFAFFANPEDGYYYMRPGVTALDRSARKLLREHQVGDVRARFMCVPDCEATIVAVQCPTDIEGGGSFVPYRPIAQGPCITDCQAREKRIEEGGRPLMDIKADVGCRPKGVTSFCACCACNAIAVCCQSEKVTEEIFYSSDRKDPRDIPFNKMVPRNPCRVWLFRLMGWGLMYLGIAMVLGPFAGVIEHAPGLTAYSSAAAFILSAIVTLATAGCIMGVAYACYQPTMILKWLCFVILIILAPLLWGGLSPYAKSVGLGA